MISSASSRWHALAERAIAGEPTSRDDARAVLEAPAVELLALLDAAYAVRRHHWGHRVLLH
ncbi:MAG: biotin synthase BioB, partial [Kofleriaceae bacterium]